MKRISWPFVFCLALLFLVALALPSAPVRADGANTPPTDINLAQSLPTNSSFAAGNYCASCHVAGDKAPAAVLGWNGGIERSAADVCPAATRVREELYYTERLFLAAERARAGLPGAQPKLDDRLAGARDGYSRLLDTPVTSLDAFTSEAQAVRYSLGKVYSQINDLSDALKRRNVLLVAGLVTLVLLLALGWGFRTTARLGGLPRPAGYIPAGVQARSWWPS